MYYEVNTKQAKQTWVWKHFDGVAQDWGNSISNALELLQSCTKPSIWSWTIVIYIAPSPHSNQVSSTHTGSSLDGWMDPSQTRGVKFHTSLIAMFMGPTWGSPGADRTQVGPMLAQWTLLSGMLTLIHQFTEPETEARLCLTTRIRIYFIFKLFPSYKMRITRLILLLLQVIELFFFGVIDKLVTELWCTYSFNWFYLFINTVKRTESKHNRHGIH